GIRPHRWRRAEMNGEEFKDDDGKALARELIDRLTRRSAWRATWPILMDFAVIALSAAVALAYWFSLPITILAVLVIGTRQHALFVVAHDAAHYLLFENRKVNDAVGRLCATVQGLSMRTY